jgi:hypothetical protein
MGAGGNYTRKGQSETGFGWCASPLSAGAPFSSRCAIDPAGSRHLLYLSMGNPKA